MICHAYRVGSVESGLLSWPLRGLENHQESFLFQESWGEVKKRGAGRKRSHSDGEFKSSLTFSNFPSTCPASDAASALIVSSSLCHHDNIHIHTCAHIFVSFLLQPWRLYESGWFQSSAATSCQLDSCFNKRFRYSLNKYHGSSMEVKRLQLLWNTPFLCVQDVVFRPKLPGRYRFRLQPILWSYYRNFSRRRN